MSRECSSPKARYSEQLFDLFANAEVKNNLIDHIYSTVSIDNIEQSIERTHVLEYQSGNNENKKYRNVIYPDEVF